MPINYNPSNIQETLAHRQIPTVVMWNRLESRPRTHHFNKALKAEVRDALWMLTKQWQMSEFTANDAGSPVLAKVHISTSHLTKYKAADKTEQELERNAPLEVKAEQKKIPFTRDGKDISIDIRLQMGRYWLKLLRKEGLNLAGQYIQNYPFILPANTRTADYIYAHREVWQQYAAISGRSIDGYKLYLYLVTPGHNASDGITNADPEKTSLDNLGIDFIEWVESMYNQPVGENNDAWLPDQLEYQFQYSASTQTEVKTLKAQEYYQGHLDWYAFDIHENKRNNAEEAKNTFTHTFIPSPVKFDGMPDIRWWKFEDGQTSLGDVQPSTTDLSKLLLMEFGLVFANDWFVIPFTLLVGSLANIQGLTVTNNFGETTWIRAAEEDNALNIPWSMFKLCSTKQNNTLFLAPSAIKVQEGNPLEDIVLIRDEMSNTVWGIESVVPLSLGKGEKGNEAALRIRQFHERMVLLIGQTADEALFYLHHLESLGSLSSALDSLKTELERIISDLSTRNPDVYALVEELKGVRIRLASEGIVIIYAASERNNNNSAKISYLAMTDIPENWIPFIPVHKKDDNRETQLQRASMLRIIEGDTLKPKVKPQTSILREGLENVNFDGTPHPLSYYIHEEEVPRSGARVTQSFQRTRWVNGEVFVWLGMKKELGRGEGSSGLVFDQIKNIE